MIHKKEFVISPGEMIDITGFVLKCVEESKIRQGLCSIYQPYCNCAIIVLGNKDVNIQKDVANDFARLVPPRIDYLCADDPMEESAHTKSFIAGSAKDLAVEDGCVVLGENRSVFLTRFAGEGTCTCVVTVIGE
ncbi:MAG: secondary thiamine-phosphate synthase enzyme YjbQ [Lachnospiraceae bacterium]|nr:secondary thiamine-phosphate synthase enzyme YjbQ [Lachnospiraceae bacterium]